MLTLIYQELLAIKKELKAIRSSLERVSVKETKDE